MKKTMKRNVVLSSILAIVLCVSLIAGGTFALFTSESKVNIAVTSGKVKVEASIDEDSVYTKELNDKEYIEGDDNMYEATVEFGEEGLTLTNIVPGDGIKFNIVVTNNSNVTIQYRTIIACIADNGLFEGLDVTIDDEAYEGITRVSSWETLGIDAEPIEIPVTIELPSSAENEYQEKTLTFIYKVEAIQGNAETQNPDPNTYYIYTSMDLANLKNAVANYDSAVLLSDIDMEGVAYTPFDLVLDAKTFTFDGNGHTIKNFAPTGTTAAKAGLFSYNALSASVNSRAHNAASVSTFVIRNLTMESATVEQTKGDYSIAAVLLGNAKVCNVEINGCTVKDSTIKSDDYAAALIGYGENSYDYVTHTIKNCTVENCAITGNGNTAGLMGLTNKVLIVEKANVKGNTINGGKGHSAAAVLGAGNLSATDVVAEKNTYVGGAKCNEDLADATYGTFHSFGSYEINGKAWTTAAALIGDFNKGITVNGTLASMNITLDKDYVITDAWTSITLPMIEVYQPVNDSIVIDGNGHTISGLTAPLVYGKSICNITIKNLTIKDSVITRNGDSEESCGAFVAYKDNHGDGSITMEKCHLINSSVLTNGGYAGALIGYTSTTGGVTIDGCSVIGCTIKSAKNVGGLIGFCMGSADGTFIVKNSTVSECALSGSYEGQIVGTVNGAGTFTIEKSNYTGSACGRKLITVTEV